MCVELAVYRAHIGLFVHPLGVAKSRKPSVVRRKVAVCHLAVAFLLVASVLALCGDVEANPGPYRKCIACDVHEQDAPGTRFCSIPVKRFECMCII